MQEMLDKAYANGYAMVTNTNNLEWTKAILKATKKNKQLLS